MSYPPVTKFGRVPPFCSVSTNVSNRSVGAGDVALGGERGLVEGVTACLDAAGLGRLDDNPRSVEVTRDHIAASVHELIRGRGVVSRILPAAGEDDPHGRIGIGLGAAPRTLFC